MERYEKQVKTLFAVLLCLFSACLFLDTLQDKPPVPFTSISAKEEGAMINLNTASAQELADGLSGIGPVLAQRIVDYRGKNGPFQRIEDLMLVSGIGEGKFSAIRDQICV